MSNLHHKLCDQSAYLERCSTELRQLRNRDDRIERRQVRVILRDKGGRACFLGFVNKRRANLFCNAKAKLIFHHFRHMVNSSFSVTCNTGFINLALCRIGFFTEFKNGPAELSSRSARLMTVNYRFSFYPTLSRTWKVGKPLLAK